MEKVIKDGMVAVLVSGDYGAGWYSWNSDCAECLFFPEIVNLIESCDGDLTSELQDKIAGIAVSNFGKNFYAGGVSGLYVEWVKEGTPFEIDEYDGYESLNTSDREWIVA